MQNMNTIAVLGGTGKAGRYIVQQLLAKEYKLRLLLRFPEKFTTQNELIEIIQGDARKPESINKLLKNADAVISALGQPVGEPTIFSEALNNIIRAMDVNRIKRYIGLTGLNVDTPEDQKSAYTATATQWMKDNYPKTTADKQIEWEILSKSNIDWTLVRLPMIDMTDEKPEIIINLTNCPGEHISATSLADFVIDQLNETAFVGKAPFIANSINA